MHFTSLDTHERNKYAERTISRAAAVLQLPEIVRLMGQARQPIVDRLGTLVVANVDISGFIEIPQEHVDKEVVPLVPLHFGEEVKLGASFGTQLLEQVEATLKTFELWEPMSDSASGIYNGMRLMHGYNAEDGIPIKLNETTNAFTGSSSMLYSTRTNLSQCFKVFDETRSGIVLIRDRPALLTRFREGMKFSPQADVIHELVHVNQFCRDPIDVCYSQNDMDMAQLRKELEAYHMSTIVEAHTRFTKYDERHPELLADAYISLLVEKTRRDFGFSPDDPYRPKKGLLSKLRAQVPDIIGAFDIEAMIASAEEFDLQDSTSDS